MGTKIVDESQKIPANCGDVNNLKDVSVIELNFVKKARLFSINNWIEISSWKGNIGLYNRNRFVSKYGVFTRQYVKERSLRFGLRNKNILLDDKVIIKGKYARPERFYWDNWSMIYYNNNDTKYIMNGSDAKLFSR